MPNYMTKGYDANQVIRSVYDVNKNCLRVCIDGTISGPGGGLEIVIDHASDSIRIGDGTNLVTTTQAGAKVGLDTVQLNDLIPSAFDDVEVTAKNADGCPTTIVYRNNAAVVATLTVTYDVDGDLERVTRS